MSCSVEFMGLSLKHPVIVAAGPWARDGASIQRCVDAGAAAVVTETITLEANPVLRPRLYYDRGRLFNTKLYSDLHLEQWEGELEQVRLGQCRLIASIWATSPSELAYLAARMERMGAMPWRSAYPPPSVPVPRPGAAIPTRCGSSSGGGPGGGRARHGQALLRSRLLSRLSSGHPGGGRRRSERH